MAATPKRRHTKSRRNNRRAHHMRIARELVAISKCPQCNVIKTPHMICWNCGSYKGQIITRVL